MTNFWQEYKQPVFSLAPMEDVTDTVFREIVMGMTAPGKLHVVFTEFTSVEGMNHPAGRDRVAERLVVNESERQLLQHKQHQTGGADLGPESGSLCENRKVYYRKLFI